MSYTMKKDERRLSCDIIEEVPFSTDMEEMEKGAKDSHNGGKSFFPQLCLPLIDHVLAHETTSRLLPLEKLLLVFFSFMSVYLFFLSIAMFFAGSDARDAI